MFMDVTDTITLCQVCSLCAYMCVCSICQVAAIINFLQTVNVILWYYSCALQVSSSDNCSNKSNWLFCVMYDGHVCFILSCIDLKVRQVHSTALL